MFAILVTVITVFTLVASFLFYYNNIARFHRIHLYGRPSPARKRTVSAPSAVFGLRSAFEKKHDRALLDLLAVRTRPVVVCLGDSITHGIVSTNYVDLLQQKYKGKYIFVNSGINGNLAYNIAERLDTDCIALDPDYVTILIGTNDVNSLANARVRNAYVRIQRLPQVPDREFFVRNLTAVVRRIRIETRAKIALLSLPVIGEDLDSAANARAREYSDEIRRIAGQEGAAYLPLNEMQVDYLRGIAGRKTVKEHGRRAFLTLLLVLGRGFDSIAAINGRRLTYDGLHETSEGARMIVSLIGGFLETVPRPACDAASYDT
jgi:lysophospholipase L1-like esterase